MKIDSTLIWKQEADTWTLSIGEENLIIIGKSEGGVRPFYLENRSFYLNEPKGWSKNWIIKNEANETILTLKYRFWSSKGLINFKDSTQFECHYKNLNYLSLVFKELKYGDEILSYRIPSAAYTGLKPEIIVHKSEVFTDKLLFLLALGMGQVLHALENEIDFTTLILLSSS